MWQCWEMSRLGTKGVRVQVQLLFMLQPPNWCYLLLQMESTIAMQAVAPRVKELQARYANDPENLQLETAKLYKSAGMSHY